MILQFFIISKVLYYAPFLGSNNNKTPRVQTLVYKGMLWSINSTSKNSNSKSKDIIKNSFISMYVISCDLQHPPLAAICAAQPLKYFMKMEIF